MPSACRHEWRVARTSYRVDPENVAGFLETRHYYCTRCRAWERSAAHVAQEDLPFDYQRPRTVIHNPAVADYPEAVPTLPLPTIPQPQDPAAWGMAYLREAQEAARRRAEHDPIRAHPAPRRPKPRWQDELRDLDLPSLVVAGSVTLILLLLIIILIWG